MISRTAVLGWDCVDLMSRKTVMMAKVVLYQYSNILKVLSMFTVSHMRGN
ncbi:MAG: hypothetical protein FD188_3152 [Ignavibacteria bacterium]|nr:MAG: hypothetical protein FD188_3152 [Ignavibacteria bacterium]